MADNSSLGLFFEISSDPSKATAAVDTFSTESTAALAKLEVQMASTTAASSAMAKDFGESMSFTRGAALAADDFGASMNTATEAVHHHGSEMGEARHAIRGLGEEVGIHMPRFVSNYISSLQGVAPAMTAAFSGVAIIGIIQLVAEVLPEAYKKLEGAITGWDEKAEKAYEKFLKENEAADKAVRKFALDMANVGKTPQEAAENTARAASGELAELGARMKIINTELEELKRKSSEAAAAATAFDETGFGASGAGSIYDKQIAEAEERKKKLQSQMDDAAAEVIATQREQQKTAAEEKYKTSVDSEKKRLADEKTLNDAAAQTALETRRVYQKQSEAAMDQFWADLDQARQDDVELDQDAQRRKAEAQQTYVRQSQEDMDKFWEDQDRMRREDDELDRDKLQEKAERERVYRKQSEDAMDKFWADRATHSVKAFEKEANAAVGMFSMMAGMMRQNHAIEVALIIARGAIKSAEQIAEGMAAAATGNFWGAAMHYAAAGAFAALSGYSAATSGGSQGSGGSASPGAGAGQPSGPVGPVAMAAGSIHPMGGNVHVIVSSNDHELANHISSLLTNNVRHGGGQLIASGVSG